MDYEKIKAGVSMILEGIGENVKREGLIDTPDRVAKMCSQLFCGLTESTKSQNITVFEAPNNDIIVEKEIAFYSMCEHHLLPFWGKAAIGYIPNEKVAGLSKLARIVEQYARRPQMQEKMTYAIANDIEYFLQPRGVIVILEAEHMCMTMRGVQKPGTKTVTMVTRGVFSHDENMQQLFQQIIK